MNVSIEGMGVMTAYLTSSISPRAGERKRQSGQFAPGHQVSRGLINLYQNIYLEPL